jgi:hypothetical protein
MSNFAITQFQEVRFVMTPTRFTHLLPRGYACLTPRHGGGCSLVGGPGSTVVFLSQLPESLGLAAGLSPLRLLLGLFVLSPSFATNAYR